MSFKSLSHRIDNSRTDRRRVVLGGLAASAGLFAPGVLRRRSVAAQETNITFMHWGSLVERDVMESTVNAFNGANSDITVEQLYVPGDYDTKLNTLAAANDLPDIFYQAEADTLTWAAEGRALDLTSFVKETPQLANRLPQSFYYYEPGKIGGAMLAGEMTTLYYNKDLFDQAGVAYPPTDAASAWTWDQFVEVAKLLTLDNGDRNATDPEFDGDNIKQFGITIPRWFLLWYPLLRGNGGDITDAEGLQYTLNSPEAVDVFQKLQDLTFLHKVSPTLTQSENIPATNIQLQTRRAAMSIDGQWALLDIADAGVNFGIGVLPKLQEPLTLLLCNASAINAASPNLDATKRFYLFHNDPANNMEPYAKGLWMPLELKYFQEEEFINQWTDNEVHPPEYRTAVIDYVLNHSVVTPAATIKNFTAINTRIEAGLDDIWTGKTPAQEALDALASVIQPELRGLYPTA